MKAALYLRVANDDQSEALSQQEFYLSSTAQLARAFGQRFCLIRKL